MAKKQTTIPGTERKTHADIVKAAEAYVKARDERMALTKKEVETKSVLAAAMKKHNLDTYVVEGDDEDLEVTFEQGEEKLKVKRITTDDE